jgi:hypothetical protein
LKRFTELRTTSRWSFSSPRRDAAGLVAPRGSARRGTRRSGRPLTHAVVARLAPHLAPKRRMVVLCFAGSRVQAVREAQACWNGRVYREATVVPVTVG